MRFVSSGKRQSGVSAVVKAVAWLPVACFYQSVSPVLAQTTPAHAHPQAAQPAAHVHSAATTPQAVAPAHLKPAALTRPQAEAPPSQQELQSARAHVRANPSDAKARLALAELLRRAGRHREAAQEYLDVVDLEPANYLVYHQLSVINADPAQLDEGIARLTKLKDENPRELMLRVALSELLEKRGNYYQAARSLVDLQYQNAVPAKYHAKINARIHYLLTKAKDAHSQDKSLASEEELDSLPPPLPDSGLGRDLTQSKLKESRVMRGVGNAPLLP